MEKNPSLCYSNYPNFRRCCFACSKFLSTAIPVKYTGDGENVNPPLKIDSVPEGTQSLVVIMDDPILPFMTWNHWVMWNIPVSGVVDENSAPGVQGRNSWNSNAYGGPDPPFGPHTYHFKAYALDTMLDLKAEAGKSVVLNAMNNHVLAKSELYGVYP